MLCLHNCCLWVHLHAPGVVKAAVTLQFAVFTQYSKPMHLHEEVYGPAFTLCMWLQLHNEAVLALQD